MLKKAWRFLTMILWLLITICMLYIIGLLFGIVPKNYMPAQIFPQQYSSFMTYLSNDAGSKSSTAGFSGALYDYISGTPTTETAPKPEDTKPADPGSPVTKAKESVDKYNQSIQNEKQKLDQY